MSYSNRFPSGSYEYEPADNARSSLAASITDSSLTIQLSDDAAEDAYVNFPTGAGGSEAPFIVTIENEQILIYSRSGDTLTVYAENTHSLGYLSAGQDGRGYAGTSPAAHTIPAGGSIVCYEYITTKHIGEMAEAIHLLETNKAGDSAVVHDTGNETIAGIKTFSSFGITPSAAPSTDYQFSNKKYVDDVFIGVAGSGFGGEGTDGALVITSGVVNISLDVAKHYTTMSITGTGALSTADSSGKAFMLHSTGNCTITSSAAAAIDGKGKVIRSADTTITTLINETITMKSSGNGGTGSNGGTDVAGGGTGSDGGSAGANKGYGGGGGGGGAGAGHGGGGCLPGGTPGGIGGAGGVGAAVGSQGGTSAGGGGAGKVGSNGGKGGDAYSNNGQNSAGNGNSAGGGGGGGEPGGSGVAIAMNIDGNMNVTGATLDASGGTGNAGGAGGSGMTTGGGGGGGGGGGAADIHIKYSGTYIAGTYTVDNGAGGAKGAGGAGGSAGSNGSGAGTTNIEKITLIF